MESTPSDETSPFVPWPHQKRAFDNVHGELYEKGRRSTAVVVATGGGKTTIAGMLARHTTHNLNRNVLFIAHRDELCAHAVEDFEALGVPVAVEKADRYARREIHDAKVDFYNPRTIRAVVASVQSLTGQRLDNWPQDFFDEIYFDECHHSLSRPAKGIRKNFFGQDVIAVNGYRQIADHFRSAKYVGFSATVKRDDGRKVEEMYESIAIQYLMREARKDGILVPIDQRRSTVRVDLSKVKMRGLDLNQGQMEDAILPFMVEMCRALKENIEDRPFLVFTPGRDSKDQPVRPSQLFAAGLQQLGMDCHAVWGDHPDRASLIEAFKAGRLQGLVNADLLTEGFDCKRIAAIGLCRATTSNILLEQIVGRGLRVCPETGKTDLRLIDFDWGLSPDRISTVYHMISPDGTAEAASFAEEIIAEGILTDAEEIADEAERRAEAFRAAEEVKKAAEAARKAAHEAATARSDEEKKAAREEAMRKADERRLQRAAKEEEDRNRLTMRAVELGITPGKSTLEFLSYDFFSSALSISGLADRQWSHTTLKASQRQVMILEDYGISRTEAEGYPRDLATEMQTLLFQRHLRNMARVDQVRDLLTIGYSREEAWSMTRREAKGCIEDHTRRHKGA